MLAMLLVAVASVLLLRTDTGRERLRRLLVAELGGVVRGTVRIGRLEGRLPGELVLRDVAILDSAGAQVLGAERIAAVIDVPALLRRRIEISRLELDRATLLATRSREGKWNLSRLFGRLGDDDAPSDGESRDFGHWVRIADVRLRAGRVTVREQRQRGEPDRVTDARDIEARLPRMLLSHPDTSGMVIELGGAALIATPPGRTPIGVRELAGTLRAGSDTIRLDGWRIALPGSRARLEAAIARETRAVRAVLHADSLSFADLLWLRPSLPPEGVGAARIEARREPGGELDLMATGVAVRVGDATANGTIGLMLGPAPSLHDTDLALVRVDSELAERLLPNVRLVAAGELDARLRLDGPATALRTDALLTFRERRGGTSVVEARGELALRPAIAAREMRLRLRPLQTSLVRAFSRSFALRGSLGGSAIVSGGQRDGWRIAGDLSHLDRGARSRVIGAATLAASLRELRVDARLEPLSLVTVGRAAPQLGLRGTVRGEVHASGRRDSLAFRTSLHFPAGDSLRARGRIARGVATLDTLTATIAGARASAAGTLGLSAEREGTLRYAIDTDSIGALLRALSRRPGAGREIDGAVATSGTLRGSVRRMRVEGRATVRSLAAGGWTIARGSVDYGLGVRGSDTVAVAAALDSVRSGRLAWERIGARLDGTRSGGAFAVDVRQRPRVDYHARGDITRSSSAPDGAGRDISLALRELALRLDSAEWNAAHPARLAWRAGTLTVDSLALRRTGGGSIDAHGTIPGRGDGSLTLATSGMPLRDAMLIAQRESDVDADLSLDARIAGTTFAPRASAELALSRIVRRGDSLPDVRAMLTYERAMLEARGDLGPAAQPLLRATGRLPIELALTSVEGPRLDRDAPLVVDVRADSVPAAMLPPSDAIEVRRGWARGEVAVRGTVGRPVATGRAELRDGEIFVSQTGATIGGVLASARLDGDSIVLDSLVGRSGGPIRASGSVVIARGARRTVAATIQARDAAVLDGAQGTMHADADLSLTGTLDTLLLGGRVALLHGYVERRSPGEQALRVVASGDRELFAILDTSASVRRASGPPRAAPTRIVRTDLAVRIDPDVWYRSAPNANVEMSSFGELRVRGDLAAGDLAAGGVVLTRGGVYSFRLRPFSMVRGAAFLPGATDVPPVMELMGEHEVWIAGRGMLPIRINVVGAPGALRFSLGDPAVLPAAPRDLPSYLSLGRSPLSLLQTQSTSLSGLATSGGRLTGELGALARRQEITPALGAVLYQSSKGARDEFGVRLFTAVPSDLPPELAESRFSGARGTAFELGYLPSTKSYIAARLLPAAVLPGVSLVRELHFGVELRAGFEPRFLLDTPTIGPPQQPRIRSAFGAFLSRNWWF